MILYLVIKADTLDNKDCIGTYGSYERAQAVVETLEDQSMYEIREVEIDDQL